MMIFSQQTVNEDPEGATPIFNIHSIRSKKSQKKQKVVQVKNYIRSV